jgi:transcriptional regulator with XRE-family HTH domain
VTFVEMLREIRTGHELSQKEMAERLGISAQYLCDLEYGRRLGSVEVVNRLCDVFSRGPKGRKEWHLAAARSHGWEV